MAPVGHGVAGPVLLHVLSGTPGSGEVGEAREAGHVKLQAHLRAVVLQAGLEHEVISGERQAQAATQAKDVALCLHQVLPHGHVGDVVAQHGRDLDLPALEEGAADACLDLVELDPEHGVHGAARVVLVVRLVLDIEGIVGAKGQQGGLPASLEEGGAQELVVPVAWTHGLVGDQGDQQVEVAAPGSGRHLGALSEGGLGQELDIEQVDAGHALQPLGSVPLLGAGGDDPGHLRAVGHREVARVEVDALDQLGLEDRGAGQEVVEQGDLVAVQEVARVLGRGPPHDEEAQAEW